MADIDSRLPDTDSSDGTTGAAVPTVAAQIGGKDGSGNLQSVKVDTSGRPQVTVNGGTDGTAIGNVSDSLKVNIGNSTLVVSVADIAPASQNISAQDTATTTLVGSNSQNFYLGTPTAGSAATFTLSSIQTVDIEASLLGAGGTMVIETSMDGGNLWTRPNIFQTGTTNFTSSFAGAFSATVNVSGMTNVRVRAISAWTGTASVVVKESLNVRLAVITDSNLPVGAATAANQATVITSIQILDDVPAAQNGAFVKGSPIMGQLDDTSTVVATEDNVATARITPQRAVHTNLRNQAGTEIGTSTTPVRIDPTGTTTQPVSQTTASNLNAQVVGSVASASADSGNPVKVGSIFNSTNPTFTNGQRADVQSNRNGHVATQFRTTFSRTTGNATTTAKSGAGVLHGVIVGANWTQGIGTIYDNTAGSGTIIMQLDFGSPAGGLLSTTGLPGPVFLGPLGIEFTTGLTVVTTGSTSNDITLVFL